jgi:hypothetical protein
MSGKIARKCRRAARVTVHEIWISAQIAGTVMFPAGQNVASTLAAIRQDDAAWRASHGSK